MAPPKNTTGEPAVPGGCLWRVARHDFRQPVQSLELLASAMASASTHEARRQCAERTVELAAAMRGMIEGLTLVSRLEAGEVTPVSAQVPLARGVKAAIHSIGRYGAEIEVGSLDGFVHADPALLAVSLEGLLLYAVKFAASGPVSVTSKATKRGAAVEICFDGRHPKSVLSNMAFVELPPPAEGAPPAVGLGPALIARLTGVLGWRLELTAASDKLARVLIAIDVQPSA